MKRLLTSIVLLLLAVAGYAQCSTCACTSCPITSWSQNQVYAIDDNNTPCNKADDKLPVKIKINHSANAKYSFDGEFSVKVGSGNFVDYSYATGTATYVTVYLPYGTPANVAVQVKDGDYSNCTKSGNLSCVANNGVNCPSSCYCNSCPITSWVQHSTGTPTNGGTVCDKSDDKLPVTIKVFHQSCAENSGDGKFSVKVGNGSFVSYDYSSGNYTFVTLQLPSNTPANVQVQVKDANFSNCTEYGNLSCVAFNGVKDNTPPTVVTCPPPPPLTAFTGDCSSCTPSNTCGTTVNYCTPTATDNCGPVTVTSNYNSGSFFPVGTNTVTYNFTDGSGNTTTYSFQVTVIDNTRPIANCKPYTLTITGSTGTITPDKIDNGSTDNCNIVSRTVVPNTFTCADAGTTKTVMLIVADAAGNKDTCTSQVTIAGQPCQPACSTSCSINVNPCNSTYTGGVATNMYLGYGPQSLTLSASSTGGSNCTYKWTGISGSPTSALSSTTSANPVFTPACAGTYKYRVTISNCNNCSASTTCEVTICVKDVRYDDGCGYDKILMCYSPGNCAPYTVAVHPLLAYFFLEYCSDFELGSCNQTCMPFGTQARMTAGNKDEEPVGQEAVDKLVEQYGIGKLMADQAFDMVVFPNPTKTDFHLRVQSVIGETADVRVFDLTGRMVERASIKTNADEVVGRNLAPGAYFIEVAHGGHVKKMRVVKQ